MSGLSVALPLIAAGAAHASDAIKLAQATAEQGEKIIDGASQTIKNVPAVFQAVGNGVSGSFNALKSSVKAIFDNPTTELTTGQRDAITHLENTADLANPNYPPCNSDINSSHDVEKMATLVNSAAEGQAARAEPLNEAAQSLANSVGHLRVTPSTIVVDPAAPLSVHQGLEDATVAVANDNALHPGATSGLELLGQDRPTLTAEKLKANVEEVMTKGNPTRRLRSFPAETVVTNGDYSVSAISVAPGMVADTLGITVTPQGGHNMADAANRDGYAVRLTDLVSELPDNNHIVLVDSGDDLVEPGIATGVVMDVSTPFESPVGYVHRMEVPYGHVATVPAIVSGSVYHIAVFTAQGYTSGSSYTWLDPVTGEATAEPYYVQVASIPLITHEGDGNQDDYGVLHVPVVPNYPGKVQRSVTCFAARIVDNTSNAIIANHTLHFSFGNLSKDPYGSLITGAMDTDEMLYHVDELSPELVLTRTKLQPSATMLDVFGRAHRRAFEDPNFSAPGMWSKLLTKNVHFNTWLRDTIAAWEVDRTTGPGIREQLIAAGVLEVYVDRFINEPADWVYDNGGWPKSRDKKRAVMRVLSDIMHPLAIVAAHGSADMVDRMLQTAGDDIV